MSLPVNRPNADQLERQSLVPIIWGNWQLGLTLTPKFSSDLALQKIWVCLYPRPHYDRGCRISTLILAPMISDKTFTCWKKRKKILLKIEKVTKFWRKCFIFSKLYLNADLFKTFLRNLNCNYFKIFPQAKRLILLFLYSWNVEEFLITIETILSSKNSIERGIQDNPKHFKGRVEKSESTPFGKNWGCTMILTPKCPLSFFALVWLKKRMNTVRRIHFVLFVL